MDEKSSTMRDRAEKSLAELSEPRSLAERIERMCLACFIDGYDAGLADAALSRASATPEGK